MITARARVGLARRPRVIGGVALKNQPSSTKRTKSQEYVIKIIPDKGDTMHSIRLPKKLLKYGAATCLAGALLFVGSFGYAAYSALSRADDAKELHGLRAVAASQQEQLSYLAKKANELQDEMERISQIEQELRQLSGAEPAAESSADAAGASAGGQGGPWIEPNVRYIDKALDNTRQRLLAAEANLERVREALQAQQAIAGYQRQLSVYVPSLWPASGEVSSSYGLRWGGSDFHPGLDIANDYGTPIIATASGTVTAAGWNSGGYGNMVDIDHGNGLWTRYGHAESVAVSIGETVQKGQVIAYMGNTGFSTGPHVHYEVHADGELMNPILYLNGGE